MNSVLVARLVGSLVVIIAFAAGVLTGLAAGRKREPIRLTVTATDAVPVELDALQLTDSQRAHVRQLLRSGRDRVLSVVDQFTPAMQAAIDSTDAEIRLILTDAQRLAFDSVRAANPPLQRIIRGANPDTSGR